ncbi:YdcF family protein [Tessaracoccus palaemonis]|uniref:YdcF family protein n=1 Tax=Tessaracoccus palaemonis TaxID=2829499 RepID=A0ABX8SLF0_9ACTN|nr:YdcF family protein [Tessaracoccus palaemonis]QXT64192.1 YdcF family protein [Tessaracoccus palaemonis]
MDLIPWLPIVLLAAGLLIGVLVEPRRFGQGIALTLLAGIVASLLLVRVGDTLNAAGGNEATGYLLLGIFLLMVLGVALLGLFLVVNAFTMWRREGLGPAPRISGLAGLATAVYVVAAVATVVLDLQDLVPLLLLVGLPAAYVAFLFVSFLSYSLLYVWFSNRFGRPVDAVIVLGSGLAGGERVTPLLAGRLRKGRQVFERSARSGRQPVLIVSGGRGGDEHLSEAAAMSRWLTDDGFRGPLALEDRSTDTAENLEFSAELIGEERRAGRVAVATSDYHAFRAAIIMRKAGIRGYTVGCRTARYYWPSATLREFIAILLEHSRFNLVVVGLLCLPLAFYIVNVVTSAFS